MSSTSIQTAAGPTPLPPQPPRPTPRREAGPLRRALFAVASLRLTVVLFVLSLVLVFVGTLAQMDAGIGTVVQHYFRAWYAWVPLQVFVRFGQVFLGVPQLVQVPGGFPFPGGKLLGVLLLVNLLAAHAVRFRLTWKRAGVLTLHAGLILLFLGEFVTGQFASEGLMTIPANGASNFVAHREVPELAVVGPVPASGDEVTVIPAARLRRGGVIVHDQLPFDVRVDEFQANSRLVDRPAGAAGRATAGEGLRVASESLREGAGVNADQPVDLTSAYVTFLKKGTDESLGTYLLSEWLSEFSERPAQTVTVDGKTYEVALRFQRTYKPYTIQLREFRHDIYPGTDIPKNFSSQVRLVDSARGEDREAKISMNAPLRYEGKTPLFGFLTGNDTFYQQGFLPGDTGTILQVVTNPGWTLPYIACFLVAAGMLVHFGITLWGFLGKQRLPGGGSLFQARPAALPLLIAAGVTGAATVLATVVTGNFALGMVGMLVAYGFSLGLLYLFRKESVPGPAPAGLELYVPWLVVAGTALTVLVLMAPPSPPADGINLREAAELPVQEGGRVKPLDSFARNTLMQITDRQSFEDLDGKAQPAIKWVLDVMASRFPGTKSRAEEYKVFRIENDEVLGLLGLTSRSGLRYSVAEFAGRMDKLEEEAARAHKVEEKDRTLFQTKVLELARKVESYVEIARLQAPHLIPPTGEGETKWRSLAEAAMEVRAGGESPAALSVLGMVQSYAKERPEAFNKQVADYRAEVDRGAGAQTRLVGFELFFNDFQPFYVCTVLYALAFVLTAVSWIGWSGPLNRTAFYLTVLTLLIHTSGLVARMIIGGRPPVTNLYSSAIFIGWVGVLLGLALETLFRIGLGNALAAALGFAGVLIAHLLAAAGGDTLEMMRAVLDTNFWLATHVTCVTIGYGATFLAGFLGVLYILCGVLARPNEPWAVVPLVVLAVACLVVPALGVVVLMPGAMSAPAICFAFVSFPLGLAALLLAHQRGAGLEKVLSQLIYGVVCFATLFSFVGTVLGGIWADQSWGRFWGWDPKENGALLIVIMNALILHARWGGLVKARGVAVLAVLGNLVVGWSWFGTNQLGIGLHSYGFNNGMSLALTAFWASQVAVVALGLTPRRHWALFGPRGRHGGPTDNPFTL